MSTRPSWKNETLQRETREVKQMCETWEEVRIEGVAEDMESNIGIYRSHQR
jgi:predicted transcriptional regulator